MHHFTTEKQKISSYKEFMLALKEEKFILLTFFISSKRKPPTSFFKKFYYKSPGAFGIIVEITIDRALLHKPFLSPD